MELERGWLTFAIVVVLAILNVIKSAQIKQLRRKLAQQEGQGDGE